MKCNNYTSSPEKSSLFSRQKASGGQGAIQWVFGGWTTSKALKINRWKPIDCSISKAEQEQANLSVTHSVPLPLFGALGDRLCGLNHGQPWATIHTTLIMILGFGILCQHDIQQLVQSESVLLANANIQKMSLGVCSQKSATHKNENRQK